MIPLDLPHKDPIKFAKFIISKNDDEAIVKVEFTTLPSLPMLVEAAAQSSAALGDGKKKIGYLVTVKNIELLSPIKLFEYSVKVRTSHTIDKLNYFTFEVYTSKDIAILKGEFIIALT